MIKIGKRIFVPIKLAANHVGYSVDWVRNCSASYNFPERVVLTERKTGYWLDELDSWLKSRTKRRAPQKHRRAA